MRRSLALVAALFLHAGDAHAATVTVRADPDSPSYDEVHVVAATGEANRITIAHADARTVRIEDAGAPLTPGAGCAAVDEATVMCTAREDSGPRQWLADVRVEAGDMGDEVRTTGSFGALVADGGPGDDRLTGGPVSDRLTGGGGADVLEGADGVDEIADGDSQPAGDDLLDGGPGRDLLTYAARHVGVRVDLASGVNSDGDVLRGFERLTGSMGDDRLTGDRRANELVGLGGRDRLAGRGGSDALDPGRGDDELSCGRGRQDVVRRVRRSELVGRACETIVVADERHAVVLPPTLRRAGRDRVRLRRLRCPWHEAADMYHSCRGTVRVREAGGARRLLAEGRFRRGGEAGERGKAAPVYLRLTALGRRLAGRDVRAVVSVRGVRFPTGGWTIRLAG